MDDQQRIKVKIAERTYPLIIHRDEEENIRKAVDKINSTISAYRKMYPQKDGQDFLAMTLIQYATHMTENEENQKAQPVINAMQEANYTLAELLKNE